MNYTGLVKTTTPLLKGMFDDEEVDQVLSQALENLSEGLVRYGRINIRNFGSFERKWMEPRRRRMVQTGEIVTVPGYWKIRFRPATKLKRKVQVVNETVRTATPPSPEQSGFLGGFA